MPYDFGASDFLYEQMTSSEGVGRFFRSNRQKQIREIADTLGGRSCSPADVFAAFDALAPDKTRFPPFPRRFLERHCADRDFRRTCRRYWNCQEETMFNLVDANELDFEASATIWLFYLGFVFALFVSFGAILPFSIDARTAGVFIILFSFVRVMDTVIEAAFGVSARLVRRGIKLARLRKANRL